MQPKETFTIKELSELFEISRQAISKHVDKLDPSLLAKNERGYKVVLRSGVLQLARNLGNQRLLDKLHEHEQNSDKMLIYQQKTWLQMSCSISCVKKINFYVNKSLSKNKIILIYTNS